MVCIYCDAKHKTAVVNSRTLAKTGGVWRRRRCANCGGTITTRESVDYETALRVRKNGALKPFQRDYLYMSVYASVSHRKTACADATRLTETIIARLLGVQTNGVLEVSAITSAARHVLSRFDPAAGIHYRAHHP